MVFLSTFSIDSSRDLEAVSAQAFDAEELAHFRQQTRAEKLQSFYQLWSRKEARHKLACNAAVPLADESWLNLTHPDLAICLASARRLPALPQLVEIDSL